RPMSGGPDRASLVSFPKIRSGRIRAVRENQTIIQCDGCDHLPAWNIYRRSAQVAAPALSWEPLSASSAQHYPETTAATSAAAGEGPGPNGLAAAALAKPAGFGSSCAAGHHPAVASGRVQDLLALEIPRSARKAP